jgi:hypothetical protein
VPRAPRRCGAIVVGLSAGWGPRWVVIGIALSFAAVAAIGFRQLPDNGWAERGRGCLAQAARRPREDRRRSSALRGVPKDRTPRGRRSTLRTHRHLAFSRSAEALNAG